MKKRLLFCSFVGMLTACQREGDVQPTPATLAGEVAGIYRTNFYLDPSCVAIPTGQLPSAELKAESDSTVTLLYNRSAPTGTGWAIQHVRLSRQTNGIQFRIDDSIIGTLQTDRVFTDNGMEEEGKLLRFSLQTDAKNVLNFAGIKQ